MKTIVSVMIFGFSLSVMHSYQENTRLVQSAQPPSDYDDFAQNTSYLTHIIDNNDMFALAAAMVLDSYIIPAAPEISTVLTSELQLSYIDKIAYELPYPMIIIKQIILHKLANDDALAQNYANVLVHAYPFFKQQFIRQFASDPLFSDILPIINNFKYKEDLTLQNWLHAH